ncbi:MAG: hypothetical protein CFE21_14685 [Bacteroidetes bacterium B1(2017)]|nr:MAG: hypothetical protein CFE21_14685 [Bacteroidetes bacterium B1(2017)]
MEKLRGFLLVSLLVVLGQVSCTHKSAELIPVYVNTNPTGGGNGNGGGTTNPNPCDPNIVYFTKDILPILNSNCAMSGCHDNITAKEGIVLNSYAGARAKVTPYSLNSSKIYKVMVTSNSKDIMPPAPNSKLSQTQLDLIAKWINQGAQNLTCNSGNCDTSNVTYSGVVSKTINTYCYGCHNGASAGGGINLSSHAGVASIAANGKLMGSIQGVAGYSAMPKGSKLDECQIKQIQIWVKAGALNN